MFSPFLHYTSIPPPPLNFQEGSSHHSSEQIFGIDQDPFSSPNPVKMAQKLPENHPMYDTQSDDCSDENSTVSSQNRDNFVIPSSSDAHLITNNASNFDEDFLKAIPTKPTKKLNQLILTQSMDNGKMFQSQEYEQDISSPIKADLTESEISENEMAAANPGFSLRERF